jgi:hypothetical protein
LDDFDRDSGDKLDLRDLFRGESTSNLNSFFFFERFVGGSVILVASAGTFSGNDSLAIIRTKADLQIVLIGVDLVSFADILIG